MQPTQQEELASLGERIAIGLIDLILVFVGCLVLAILTGLGRFYTSGLNVKVNVSGWRFLVLSGCVFLLFAGLEYSTGRTPGKYLVGGRTRGPDQRRLTLTQSLVRNLARYVDFFGFGLVGLVFIGCTSEKQRFGDLLAGTRVFRD